MLKTVICDDELPALDLMKELLEETRRVAVVAACQSVMEALEVINQGGIDLAVFDIEMPDLSGVEASQRIKVEPKPLLIFATAHSEYAVDAFGVDAIDYLMKPLELDRVAKAIDKAIRMRSLIATVEEEKSSPDPYDRSGMLQVRDAGTVYFIPYNDVQLIEAAGDYSLVHTPDKEYALRTTIRSLEDKLPAGLFVRVHRSTIVAAQHVREVRMLAKGEAQITLSNGQLVKASRSYREAVRQLTVKQ